MNTDNAIKPDGSEKVASNILLPDDKQFLITRVGKNFSKDINITYRWPRMIGDAVVLLVATSTLNASKLNKLRLEEIDGHHFVVNDSQYDALKICVESEDVGHQIIKAIIDEFADNQESKDEAPKDDLDLPERYWRFNKIAEEFAPLIFVFCGVLLSISASFWLIFK
jgi:hypothetical protein